MAAVLWFRRDLRVGDNPALLAAAAEAPDGVLPLFVLDPLLLEASGEPRKDYLFDALRSLSDSIPLVIRTGDPTDVVPAVAREIGASSVHIAADYGPYGLRRDATVAEALAADRVELVRTGSSYAVAPGRILTGAGTPYKVFTPYSRAWLSHGWRAPAESSKQSATWLTAQSDPVPKGSGYVSDLLPPATEVAALQRLRLVVERGRYDETRDLPGIDGTTLLSPALKWGLLHPRTILAAIGGDGSSEQVLRKEICWREFYADVLHHNPSSARESMHLRNLEWDDSPTHLRKWADGQTGYPIVDAGMRQLLAEGWMHNRIRMVVASFLVKDLHLDWRLGARHFMRHLIDGDLASNQHGWQWTAGTGTDAAPFFRIFNPVQQGKRWDADGAYVRKYVPELRDVEDKYVHEPWQSPSPPVDYPAPIVDHAAERDVALARLKSAG